MLSHDVRSHDTGAVGRTLYAVGGDGGSSVHEGAREGSDTGGMSFTDMCARRCDDQQADRIDGSGQ